MKKNTSLLLFSLLGSLGLASNAHAAWYETTGSATIVSSEDQARQNAIEDALYKAVRFAGADIGSLPNLQPFLEQKRKEYHFTNHEVRYILVEKERKRNGALQLTVRVDIYPSATSCHMNQYKKTVLFENIAMDSPQQAVMGQIYDLGNDFTQVLNRQLATESASFTTVGTTPYELDREYPERIKMVAQDTGAQYLISGHITDLTATVAQRMLSQDTINRQFSMEMQVFDGKTGQEIYRHNYRDIALWPFAKTSQVDTKSARFWASTYGEMLLRVSRNVMLDLESELACKISLPEVVAKFDHTITMDLGRVHGVRVGDRLKLWHTDSFIDQNGLPRNKVTESDVTLTVSRVYENEAELSVDQGELAGSIQIGDVMHKVM